MTLEDVISAKETLSRKIKRVSTIQILYLYNSSGHFSLQIQSLLVIKINFTPVEMHTGYYTEIVKFLLQYHSVSLFIENSGCIPLVWFTSSIYTDFNLRCVFT